MTADGCMHEDDTDDERRVHSPKEGAPATALG